MGRASVSNVVSIPKSLIPWEAVCTALTITYRKMGESEGIVLNAYRETDTHILVPRAYGLHLIAKHNLEFSDNTSKGRKVRFPKAVEHTGEYAYQEAFVQDILTASYEYYDFMAHAATGKGKTVCALSVAQKRGVTTLVVVDQENLLLQWVRECKKTLGLTDAQIGVVRGPKQDYRGKHVTIAMVQSLVMREYDSEFYDYFGTVIFDECHTVGAPTFSRTLMMFSAETRFGVSATIDRRDALQKLLSWNLGYVEAELLDKHDVSYVYFVKSDTVYSWYANISPKSGRILHEVSTDGRRNNLLVRIIEWLYREGRDILVISDRIEQLEALMAMCEYAGVPKDVMGLYCGFKNVWKFVRDPTPERRPVGYVRGTEYSPVTYCKVRKRLSKQILEKVKDSAKIIFATFGMFAKGVDVPRLNAGVDCTPRSRAQQVHGRVLRVVDGKMVPLWVTIRDVCSYKLEHQFGQRIHEYVASSAEIYEWHMDRGVRSWDVRTLSNDVKMNVARLKQKNIDKCVDGRYMLATPSTQPGLSGRR